MADPTQTRSRRAIISYNQLKDITGWPDLLVNDYQGIFPDFVTLADNDDAMDAKIAANTTNIATNAANITTNATNIATNTANITTNSTNIATNTTNLTNHIGSTTEHGVTGNNVGTEDYCTTILGGVVMLMESVNNAIDSTQEITLSDIAAAPVAYNPAYTQTLADMANDTKAKHNQLVLDLNLAITQLNDLISKAKTAKQMVV